MSKRRNILAAAVVAMLAFSMIAASYFSTKTEVATIHETTNYIPVTLGAHAASVVRRISASNLVAVQNTVILPRTNNSGIQYNFNVTGANYERGTFGWSANVLEVGTEAGGSGALRLLRLKGVQSNSGSTAVAISAGGSDRWVFFGGGNFAPQVDNTHYMGLPTLRIKGIQTGTDGISNAGPVAVTQGTNAFIINSTNGVPATPGTILHWVPFKLNGTNGFIPFYQ